MRCLLVPLLLLTAASPGCGEDVPHRPIAARATGDFLDRQRDALARDEAALRTLGRGGDYARVRACVGMTPFDRPRPQFPGPGEQTGLADSLERRLAVAITASGTRFPTRCDEAAHAIIQAAHRTMFGRGTEADAVRFADTIVVARALGDRRAEALGDGMRSSLHFEVEARLKGHIAPGGHLVIRLESGPVGDGTYIEISGQPRAKAGERYLVLASRGRYQMHAVGHGLPVDRVRALPPKAFSGGRLFPAGGTAPARWGSTSVASVRRALESLHRPPVSASRPVGDHAAALAADAREQARTSGMPEAQALRRARISDGLGPLVEELRTRLRPRLAGIALVDHPELHLQVRLTGTGAPRSEVHRIAGESLRVRYVPNAPATVERMRQVMDRHGERISRELPGPGMGIDEREGQIAVQVAAAADGRPPLMSRAQSLSREFDVPIRLEFVEGGSVEEGGRR